MRRSSELLVLSGLLLVATVLRLHHLGDELWFDEIVTQIRVSRLDLASIATSYESQNQHLLYSLLARIAIVALGDTPAALRVPAMTFGVLSVWAVYVLGRELLSRREALLAAALLTVSDLHVWFSQNARGYAALLCATLLSSWLLLRALDGDRRRTWLGYALAATLGLWVHLTMLFVIAGHAIIVLRRRRPVTGRVRARATGPLVGFGAAALLSILIYAPIVPAVLSINAVEGRDGAIREWSSSTWAIGEVLRSLAGAFARPQLALYAVALGCAGGAHLLRRRPVLLELLLLPIAIGLVVVIGSGHHVWPRLFFFAIGFAALIVVHGAEVLGAWLAGAVRAPAWTAAITVAPAVVLVAAAAAALPDAYGPKQRHAEALAFVDAALRPGDAVAAAGPAARVVQEYFGRDWPRVASADELARVRAGARRTFVVHAFPIQLRGRRPDLARLLDDEFFLLARFPGTVRGGDVLVWSSERPHPAAAFPHAPE